MPRPKMPLPKVADLAFLRSVIEQLNEARQLRRFADRHIQTLRESIVKRVSTALWRRYQVYFNKGQIADDMSFFDWLVDRKTLESTYLHHSYSTRLYWVYRVIQSVKVPDMALFGESPGKLGCWYFDMLEHAINQRQIVPGARLKIYEIFAMPDSFAEPVPTVRFALEFEPAEAP